MIKYRQTIEIYGFELQVNYEYQPVEPTNYSLEAPYPGADESVSLEAIYLWYHPINILDLVSEEVQEQITKQILIIETERKKERE